MITRGYPVKNSSRDVVEFYASFVGQGAVNGALVPVNRSDGSGVMSKGLTLTRTAAGKYTLQLTPTPNQPAASVPNILQASMQVRSTNAAPVQLACQPAAYTPSTGTVTFIVYTPSTLALADPTATEFLEVTLVASDTNQP